MIQGFNLVFDVTHNGDQSSSHCCSWFVSFELVLISVLTVNVVITVSFCSVNNFRCLSMDLHASLPFDVSLNPCVNFFFHKLSCRPPFTVAASDLLLRDISVKGTPFE